MEMLKSTRFQALVVLALVGFLDSQGWMGTEIAQAFYVILGGHIGIRTIDRLGEKIGG